VAHADLIWVDGKLADSLPLPDRGLAFGDGLFETILLVDGKPVLVEFHRQRLAAGARRLNFQSVSEGFDQALELACDAAADVHRSRHADTSEARALRITVTRGEGPRGYAPPAQGKPRIVSQLSSLAPEILTWQAPARLGVSSIGLSTQPLLAGIKHLNRLEQVLAATQCREQGLDEALMCDQQGAVISVVAGNLFVVSDGCLLTSPLVQCGVAGTRRRAIIERWAPALGLDVQQQQISVQQCREADELLFCNSLQGVRGVAQLAGRSWTGNPVARALHGQYQGELRMRGLP